MHKSRIEEESDKCRKEASNKGEPEMTSESVIVFMTFAIHFYIVHLPTVVLGHFWNRCEVLEFSPGTRCPSLICVDTRRHSTKTYLTKSAVAMANKNALPLSLDPGCSYKSHSHFGLYNSSFQTVA